ncbi:MAG: gamma-glutamyltransferase [Anaerolineaceae bacterium]|nr:gamma-glutamyltransferase [Anaerolineaceae bacterium]
MKIAAIEEAFEPSVDGKCAYAEGGMVATAFPEATRAGVEMLEQGGNAIDAACAASLALSVCEPQASGIGGQSMAILNINGRTIALDGSSRVPSLAHLSQFNENERLVGYKATTVPSTIAVLGHLNRRYGRLKWSTLFEPAIRIAKEGYRITELQNKLQTRELEKFKKVPKGSGARYFLKDNSLPFAPGDLFCQSDLGNLLETLADQGPMAFYRGEIARQIDEDMRAHGGFLRYDDLALIPHPIERRPIRRRFRGMDVYTIPPPAAGRTLLLVLRILNHIPSKFLRSEEPETYHFMAEAFRKAFLLRTQRPYDPNTYPQVSDKKMLSRSMAKSLAISIRDIIDHQLPMIEPPVDEGETTHLSVMDSEGNAIGITQSVEFVYGSKTAAEGLGFLYNSYMNAFDIQNAAHPYYLRPNAIPWTTVAPAIVMHRNKPWLLIGSPGSERIYSTISQFLVNMIDKHMPLCKAMYHPRLHCSIGGTINLEGERFDPGLVKYLEEMGYRIKIREPYSFYLGAVHAVMNCQSLPGFQGVAEVRRDGSAEGPN